MSLQNAKTQDASLKIETKQGATPPASPKKQSKSVFSTPAKITSAMLEITIDDLVKSIREDIKQRRYASALMKCRSLIEKDKNNAEWYFLRGCLGAFLQGKEEDSITDWLRVTQLNKKDPLPHVHLICHAYFRSRDITKASAAVVNVITALSSETLNYKKIRNAFYFLYVLLALKAGKQLAETEVPPFYRPKFSEVLLKQNEPAYNKCIDAAIKDVCRRICSLAMPLFERSIVIQNVPFRLPTIKKLVTQARQLFEQKEINGALSKLQEVIFLDKSCHEFFQLRGEIYYSQYEFKQAQKDFSHVIKLRAANAQTYLFLFSCYYELCEFAQAAELTKEVAECLVTNIAEKTQAVREFFAYLYCLMELLQGNDEAAANAMKIRKLQGSAAFQGCDAVVKLKQGYKFPESRAKIVYEVRETCNKICFELKLPKLHPHILADVTLTLEDSEYDELEPSVSSPTYNQNGHLQNFAGFADVAASALPAMVVAGKQTELGAAPIVSL